MGYFSDSPNLRLDRQFLAGGSFLNWVHLLQRYGYIDSRYLLRAVYVSLISFLGTPFRLYEKNQYHLAIDSTQIIQSPVFILGHWRSGTTFLHQLLVQDPDFATVSFIQTMIPDLFLSNKLFRLLVAESIPKDGFRPMDNIKMNPYFPEEEEYAMGNISAYSFYHGLCFPKKMRQIFQQNVLFKNVDHETIENWKKYYLYLLKKIQFCFPHNRLVLKNPANTARIKQILEIFPQAKFIHLYRNPYRVYSSTMHWLDIELEQTAFQSVSYEKIEEIILLNYKEMMNQYFKDRNLIPPNNLIEIKFEDLEVNSIKNLEKIYYHFNFNFDEEKIKNFSKYISALSNYKKNTYQISEKKIQKINKYWKSIIKQLDYHIL